MAYPITITNLNDVTDAVSYPQAADINTLNAVVEALEAKVGINNSAVTTSIDYIIKNNIWPIGSVFSAIVSTSPATLLGFGTWSQIAQGQMLIGQKGADADFDIAEETGGNKTITLAEANLPAHLHTVNPPDTISTTESATHTHSRKYGTGTDDASPYYPNSSGVDKDGVTCAPTGIASATHTHNINIAEFNSGSTGSGTAKNIMNPYFVVYFWKRVS